MNEDPDIIWQGLIEDYLNKLHGWQRLLSKYPSGPPEVNRGRRKSKIDIAYEQMKDAQRALSEYESVKGY
nr:hypothetical protein [candidate division Zixibacteria bacterium]